MSLLSFFVVYHFIDLWTIGKKFYNAKITIKICNNFYCWYNSLRLNNVNN